MKNNRKKLRNLPLCQEIKLDTAVFLCYIVQGVKLCDLMHLK